MDLGLLNAQDAFASDQELMKTPGYTLEQLMELAGLSVAEAIVTVASDRSSKILIVCGPGNNGGDGLVAARHLALFGYQATVVYPKRSSREPHYANLVQQCSDFDIPVLDVMPNIDDFNVIVDSVFGFSFKGEPRPPFDSIIDSFKAASKRPDTTVIAVDVPSGWNVDGEGVTDFQPNVLVSLTAPKLCTKHFLGRHFVGGRFLPSKLAQKYKIRMPPYPGTSQVMEIGPSDA